MHPFLFIDFDNTMMETEPFAIPSLIDRFNMLYAAQLGRHLELEEFNAHFHGQARENLCTSLSTYFNITVAYEDLFYRREAQMAAYFKSLENGIPMAPHIIEILADLRAQGMHAALVTNNALQRIFTSLRFAANGRGAALSALLAPHFFEANDIQKPDPDVYQRAIIQTDADITRSAAIEDSVTGVRSAAGAGLMCFGFTGFAHNRTEAAEKMLAAGATACFDSWDQLPELLRRHGRLAQG